MSNVKAGDLAIVVGAIKNPRANGHIVEVIERRPHGKFQMPNGRWAAPSPTSDLVWLIKYVGGPGPVVSTDGKQISDSLYGCISDSALRPLPGDESTEDTTTEREVTA